MRGTRWHPRCGTATPASLDADPGPAHAPLELLDAELEDPALVDQTELTVDVRLQLAALVRSVMGPLDRATPRSSCRSPVPRSSTRAGAATDARGQPADAGLLPRPVPRQLGAGVSGRNDSGQDPARTPGPATGLRARRVDQSRHAPSPPRRHRRGDDRGRRRHPRPHRQADRPVPRPASCPITHEATSSALSAAATLTSRRRQGRPEVPQHRRHPPVPQGRPALRRSCPS